MSMSIRPIRMALAVIGVVALFAGSASAVTTCKAKTDAKDGTILVSASKITGTLKWGGSAGSVSRSFFDPACASGGKAKNCVFGDVGTTARITPPAHCTIFLADDTTTCSVFLKNCTPGPRDGQFPATRLDLNDGDTNVSLLTFAGIGTLQVSCAASVATTQFVNQSGTSINVESSGVDYGSPTRAFVQRFAPSDGQIVTQPNGGIGGVHAVTWQASFTDANNHAHVVTAWITAGASLTNCVVTAHAITNE